MTDRHSISVFVPALNEAGNLEGAIRDIVSAAEEVFDDYEVLIVDDGSTDHTGEEAEALGRENPKIRVIRNPGNLGFDRCHRIALARAEKKYFVFLPGDHEIAGRSAGKSSARWEARIWWWPTSRIARVGRGAAG